MNSNRTTVGLLAVAFLISGASSCASLKPEKPISTASIRVVDRFGSPVGGVDVKVTRKKKRRKMMEIPYETIASETSDPQGHARFQNLLEGDGAGATSRDGRFYGRVELDSLIANYEIRLNQHRGTAVEYRGITESALFDDGGKAAETLVKLLDHYVETQSHEFRSLDEYVAGQIISQDEADRILRLSQFMTAGDRSINFRWGEYRLRVNGSGTSLRWVSPQN